jgi:hypothetical protein
VIAVGHEQLELERGKVACVADDGDERIGPANAAELRCSRPGNIDQADRGGRLLGGVDDACDRVEPLVGDRCDPDVGRPAGRRLAP